MAIETVPLLREDSILAWDIESTFKTAPTAAGWRAFGRVDEWRDMGPKVNIFRDAIAGSGREAATIFGHGKSYGPVAFGPWQIVDPLVAGFVFGREINAPSATGSNFLHTATPTNAGRLPSMSVQASDYKAGSRIDGNTFLGVLMPKLGLRGEAVEDNGGAGRIMFAPTLLAHDDDPTVVAKTVTLPTADPFFYSHAANTYGSDADVRIVDWDATIDNNTETSYYHTSPASEKPTESPPQGITYDLRMTIVADGHLIGGELIRDIVRNKTKHPVLIKYARSSTDYFELNLTDVVLESADKIRRRGKIMYECVGYGRSANYKWTDTNASRFFPA